MLWVCFIFKFEFLFIQVLSLNSQAHSLHKLKKYTNKVEFFVSIILLQPSVWHFWYQKKKKKADFNCLRPPFWIGQQKQQNMYIFLPPQNQ